MLRELLGETGSGQTGQLEEVNQAIESFCRRLGKQLHGKKATQKEYRLDIWAEGFTEALEELEESKFCSEYFGRKVTKKIVQDMSPVEETDYRRYNYFFKNAFIRVFSILDKLGSFLNDMFELRAEAVKPHFSYFTALRQMHKLQIEPALEQQLYDLKNGYKDEIGRLRKLRNMEVHWMNTELMDDLLREHRTFADPISVENISEHLRDLNAAMDLVCASLLAVFTYCSDNNCLVGES